MAIHHQYLQHQQVWKYKYPLQVSIMLPALTADAATPRQAAGECLRRVPFSPSATQHSKAVFALSGRAGEIFFEARSQKNFDHFPSWVRYASACRFMELHAIPFENFPIFLSTPHP